MFAGCKFIKGLVKLPEPAAVFRDGNAAYMFHEESVLSVERLGVHGNPSFAEAHCLQNTKHIPPVNVIANCHHAVGEEFSVLTYFLAAFNPEAIPDPVYGETDNPSCKIYEEMPDFEFQRFVKIRISFVELDVLVLPAYRGHSCKGVVSRKFRYGFRDINSFLNFEISIRWAKF